MEIKTKYDPKNVVFFVHENKIVSGTVDSVYTKVHFDQGETKTKTTYKVSYKWVVKAQPGSGFTATDENKEKFLDFTEDLLFADKQDLLTALGA